MVWIPKNQSNCRTLQNRLDEYGKAAVPPLLKALSDSLSEMMMDPFGNYLFQKLIDFCNSSQIKEILEKIQAHLVFASKDQHGSRSIQKLIQQCDTLDQYEIIKKNIETYVDDLCIDPHGNHVLQLCMDKFPSSLSQFIFDDIQKNILDISSTKYGCYVVQKCYEKGDDERKKAISDVIIESSAKIVTNPFGNYALQFIIEKGPIEYSKRVFSLIKGNIVELSMQKYSSNVLEKLILTNDHDIQQSIVDELTIDERTLTTVAEHRFGIYVVRRLLVSSLPEYYFKYIFRVLAIFKPRFQPVYKTLQSNPKDKKNLDALDKPADQINPP